MTLVTADERAIRGLLGRLEDAWNRGDGAAYGAAFTDDSDYVAFDGTHLVGRQANAGHHQRLFDTVLAGSRLRFGAVRVRFVTPDLAVVHGDGTVLMPWQSRTARRRRSIQTYLFVRQGGEWRIAAFHNTRVRPLQLPRGLGLRLVLLAMRARTWLSGRRRGEDARPLY